MLRRLCPPWPQSVTPSPSFSVPVSIRGDIVSYLTVRHVNSFTPQQTFRGALQTIEGSPRFEHVSLTAVLANCVTLALYNPHDRECASATCQRLEVS